MQTQTHAAVVTISMQIYEWQLSLQKKTKETQYSTHVRCATLRHSHDIGAHIAKDEYHLVEGLGYEARNITGLQSHALQRALQGNSTQMTTAP